MNKWRDHRGSPASGNWGPLSVNDNRVIGDWPVRDEHHIVPDWSKMKRAYEPVPQPSRWYVSAAFAAVAVLMGVIFSS